MDTATPKNVQPSPLIQRAAWRLNLLEQLSTICSGAWDDRVTRHAFWSFVRLAASESPDGPAWLPALTAAILNRKDTEVSACQMPRYIINFPTKRHWRDLSRLEDIESGLCHLVQIVHDRQIASLAVPALGCGLGGLEWETVHSRILHALSHLTGVNILVFPPAPDRQRRDGPVVSDRKPGGGADRFYFSLFR
jgi:hypothetical protein